MTHSYSRSGSQQYITVVSLADNTQVRIQRPDRELFVGTVPEPNILTFELDNLESVRYVSAFVSYVT